MEKINRLIFSFLLTAIVLAGCATQQPDPLAGFHQNVFFTPDTNKTITDDYTSYIRTLSREEQKFATVDEFLEDGTGQHAVLITIGIHDTNYRHVLIYDKNNKRIKTVKWISGHSQS